MPKLENWSKVPDSDLNTREKYGWFNDHNKGKYVFVRETSTDIDGNRFYDVVITPSEFENEIYDTFDTLEEARKEAVNWMDDNPLMDTPDELEVHIGDEVLTEQEATERIREMFTDFKEENKSFNFNARVKDTEGFEAVILVDFGIEDYEEDAYYVGSVTARFESNPSDDHEELAQSEAFYTAQSIVDDGASVIDDAQRYPEWEMFEREDMLDSQRTIAWNMDNMS